MAEPAAISPPGRRGDGPAANGGSRPAAGLIRTSPHSVEAEEYLLGCCLFDGADSIARCLEAKLPPEAFYSAANRTIYEKLASSTRRARRWRRGAGRGAQDRPAAGGGRRLPYLSQLSSRIPTTAQAQYFIERVRELHLLRELIKVSTARSRNA